MVEGELKCKKCGAILNDFNCDELYDLHEKNIDVDNSTELMCNDCAFREDARKHVQEFICNDESLELDERMFISLKDLFVTLTKQAMQTISLITSQTTIMAIIGNSMRNFKIGTIHTLVVFGLRTLKMIMFNIKRKA